MSYTDDLIDYLLVDGAFTDNCAVCANFIPHTWEELKEADRKGVFCSFCTKISADGVMPNITVCREGMKEHFKQISEESNDKTRLSEVTGTNTE